MDFSLLLFFILKHWLLSRCTYTLLVKPLLVSDRTVSFLKHSKYMAGPLDIELKTAISKFRYSMFFLLDKTIIMSYKVNMSLEYQ